MTTSDDEKDRSMTKLTVDKKLIRDLAKILQDTGLAEVEWSEGDVKLRVSRGAVSAAYAPVAYAPPAAAVATPVAATAPAVEAPASAHPGTVKSPMVGTIYVAAEPGAAAFVKVGDTVKEGQTLVIVEAMKTMNPIPSPRAGRVTRILVENQQPVEFDQPLMIIE